MCASLDERLREDMEMLSEFRSVYKDNFIKSFTSLAHDYELLLLQILGAQSYIFDRMLWEKAKKSRVIKRFFSEAQIDGEFSSKTYLKYYLNTLDKEKASQEQRGLFKLYAYLKTLEDYTAVILLDDVDELLELKRIFTQSGIKMFSKTFLDDKSALLWAISNRANLFVLTDTIPNMSVDKFIHNYKNQTKLDPKVMVITTKSIESFSEVDRVISPKYTPNEMVNKMKEMLGEKSG
jgi:hypothetical protein